MILKNNDPMRLRVLFSLIFALLFALPAQAQDMADTLRSNGKIYVVVLVLATIFAGIIAFLIYLDRKVSRIERNKE